MKILPVALVIFMAVIAGPPEFHDVDVVVTTQGDAEEAESVAGALVSLWSRAKTVHFRGKTDDNGRAEFPRVPGYSATIRVGFEGCPFVTKQVGLEEPTETVEVAYPPRTQVRVNVTSYDSSGQLVPFEGARVEVEYPDRSGGTIAYATDSTGTANVCVFANKQLKVSVTARDYGEVLRELSVEEGETPSISIALQKLQISICPVTL